MKGFLSRSTGRPLFCAVLPAALTAVVFLVITGCAGVRTPTPVLSWHVIAYPESIHGESDGGSLLAESITVVRFTSAESCSGREMLYSPEPFRRAAYRYHRWKEAPADMITEYVAGDLRRNRMFSGVFVGYTHERSRYILEGRLVDCLEIFDDGSRQAVLHFTATLVDTLPGRKHRRRVLFQKDYRETEGIEEGGAAGMAAAMNLLAARLSERLAGDMRAAVTGGGV